ncbi:MAG: ribonuclease III [Dysgonamonadaceae bacterium]|nr:ribonuclease III [Dysgonamonadaceae bacterium]
MRRILGFFPKNIEYYEKALRHRSTNQNIKIGERQSNERLEFLGDAVLNVIISDIVFKRYDDGNEGFLTQIRSKIVARETLDRIAVDLGIVELLVLSPHLKMQTKKNHVSGNALEAFIGAIYLDRGYRKTKRFIEKKILKTCVNIDELAENDLNYKSQILEWAQKNRVEIKYELLDRVTDEWHNHIFYSLIFLDGAPSGKGSGFSKKQSEQEAAKEAMKKVNALQAQ